MALKDEETGIPEVQFDSIESMFSVKNLLVSSLVIPLLVLGACTQGTPTLDEAPTTIPEGTNTPEPVSGTQEGVGTGQATFGTSYEWSDGLSVAISKPKFFGPSPFARGADYVVEAYKFVITVTNGTNEPYDLKAFNATTSLD